jgi:hypothetical protein
VFRWLNTHANLCEFVGPYTFAMCYIPLMPIFAADVLNGDAGTQSLMMTLIGIGSVIGAISVAAVRPEHARGLPVVAAALALCTAAAAFSLSREIWLSACFAFVLGLSSVVYNSQNWALILLLTPAEFRARVMAIFMLNRGLCVVVSRVSKRTDFVGFIPVGAFTSGILAEHLGAPASLQIMTGVAVLVSRLRLNMAKCFFLDYSFVCRNQSTITLAQNRTEKERKGVCVAGGCGCRRI